MQILIFCRRPGSIRAGRPHPAFAAHLADAFTAQQLHELIADPAFTVAVGHQLTADGVDIFMSRVIADADIEAHVAKIEASHKPKKAAA